MYTYLRIQLTSPTLCVAITPIQTSMVTPSPAQYPMDRDDPVGGSIVHTSTTLKGKFGRGDKVTCTVTPRDGTLYGTSVTSPAVTISNNAPIASSVFISPNPAYATDTLDCKYTYSDADGDPESGSTFLWRVVNRAGTINTYTSQTIRGVFARDDVITCSVTPKDGLDTGSTLRVHRFRFRTQCLRLRVCLFRRIRPTSPTPCVVITRLTTLMETRMHPLFAGPSVVRWWVLERR